MCRGDSGLSPSSASGSELHSGALLHHGVSIRTKQTDLVLTDIFQKTTCRTHRQALTKIPQAHLILDKPPQQGYTVHSSLVTM
jgi:hypothetical protein